MDVPKRKVTAKINISAQPATRAPSPFKVKAKVNSVARKSPASTSRTASPSLPASPLPQRPSPRLNNHVFSNPPKLRPPSRPATATPASPTRHRSVFSDPDKIQPRARRVSTMSLSPPTIPDPLVPKIKSKLSGLAKTVSTDPPAPTNNAPLHTRRNRTPSMASSISIGSNSLPSSASSTSPSHHPYPITTAAPAANPHRFASVRASPPSTAHHYFQPFSPASASSDDCDINYEVTLRRRTSVGAANVILDPTFVPLPPISPPTSSLSFSSKSSQDYESSGSSCLHINGASNNVARGRTSMSSLGLIDSLQERDSSVDTQPISAERQEWIEAKTNRKIADLEITNASLLTINASLESTKNKQAKEIRELRRKLRESRLILPPRVYKATIQKTEEEEQQQQQDEESDPEDSDESSSEAPTSTKQSPQDATYHRVKLLLDTLLVASRQALETTPDDFMDKESKGTKVLNPDEIVRWREGRGYDDRRPESSLADTSLRPSEAGDDEETEMSLNSISLSADEAEVERLVNPEYDAQPPPPPILVTRP